MSIIKGANNNNNEIIKPIIIKDIKSKNIGKTIVNKIISKICNIVLGRKKANSKYYLFYESIFKAV
jgi:hypothetical protein